MKISAQKSSGMERSRLSPSVLPQYGSARNTRALGLEPPVGIAVDTTEDGAAGDDPQGQRDEHGQDRAHEGQRHGLDTAPQRGAQEFCREIRRKRPLAKRAHLEPGVAIQKYAQIGSGANGTPDDQGEIPATTTQE